MSIAQRDLSRISTAEYFRASLKRGNVPEDDQKDLLLSHVSTYTDITIKDGMEPTLEGFLTAHDEWDHEDLYDTIEAEINRVSAMSRKGAM
ncbi:hypothetical protein [Paenibacillus spongiae]|uniref:Antitoxin VbhA domain-containing protein n=1 Tax=Paenibacillus spongiae TaxID=2909671 RepID=A0ABY5SCC2_9BACL|nr:hypothetical protein [Paenibacillus spongiae]UVI31178.1 hypothetical protein L1F29_04870 [Paenibacillus spongiae]